MTSTARLQREADAARVELADTLGQLRDGLAPSALSSEAIALAKDSGLTLARTLADQARTNPVPALLIGAGLTMLLTRTTGGDVLGVARSTMRKAAAASSEAASAATAAATRTASEAASKAAASVSAAASRAATYAADTARGTATAVGDTVAGVVGDTVDRTQQQVSEGYDAMKDSLDSRLDEGERGLRDTMRSTREAASRLTGEAQEKAASLAHQARHSFSQLLDEQPILMAAIGAAVGAAIGAALPLSRTEKDMIGTAGARAVGMGREAVETAAEALKEEVAKSGADATGRRVDDPA